MGLNAQQEIAVNSNDKHIVCLAGAGSGKTYCLIERIHRLIADGVDPSAILALTFTRAAALEMKERFISSYPEVVPPEFRTFHSYCFYLIVNDSEVRNAIGYTHVPTIITTTHKNRIISEVRLQTGCKISEGRLQDPESITHPKEQYEYNFYRAALDKRMASENVITFDDLSYKVTRLFQGDDASILKHKSQLQHIIVDEFQDTDPLQFKFLSSFKDANIFVVGDILQSIYGFRGADSKLMGTLVKSGVWSVIKLYQNYRSDKSICNFANNNTLYADESYRLELNPISEDEGKVVCSEYYQPRWPKRVSDEILDEIHSVIISQRPAGSIAILARSNAEVAELKEYFEECDIEFNSIRRDEDSIRYLRSLTDNDYLIQWASSKLDSEQYANYIRTSYIDKPDQPLSYLYTKYGNIDALGSIIRKVSRLRTLFRSDRPLYEIEDDTLKELGYEGMRIDEFHPSTIEEALFDIYNIIQQQVNSDIYIGTIHSVKGLEFDNVILVGVEGKAFPLDNDDNLNLYYVGITRAKHNLQVMFYE